MTRRDEILLVSCYELGHAPLGLAWPMGFLERAGYAPEVLDISVQPLDEDKVRRAHAIAIAVPMHTALRLGIEVARRIRALNPAARIAFHGLYAVLHADYLLREGADAVLGGECEESLVDWVAGKPPGRSVVRERLRFPAPGRKSLPSLDRYAKLVHDGSEALAGAVEASRGCRHLCRHCPIPAVYDGRFFVVPPDIVIQDVQRLVEGGARHITFADADFLNGPGHVLKVMPELHARFPQVTFDVTTKVEHILRHAALVAELGKLGGLFVVSAVESLSDEVLRRLDKGHTRNDVPKALSIVRDAGMAFRPSWLPFTPWSMLADYLDMLRFVASYDLVDHVDPVQFAIRLLVPPGSLLLDDPELSACPLDEDRLTHVWKHADSRMDTLHAEVSALVEEAAHAGRDAGETFAQVWELAHRTADLPTGAPILAPGSRRSAPRLSEPWFC